MPDYNQIRIEFKPYTIIFCWLSGYDTSVASTDDQTPAPLAVLRNRVGPGEDSRGADELALLHCPAGLLTRPGYP